MDRIYGRFSFSYIQVKADTINPRFYSDDRYTTENANLNYSENCTQSVKKFSIKCHINHTILPVTPMTTASYISESL